MLGAPRVGRASGLPRLLGIAAGITLALAAGRAHGALVTFRATGQVTQIADSAGAVPGVGFGTPYTLEYDFDPATADQDADPAIGLYPQPSGELRADLDGTMVRCPAPGGLEVAVADDDPVAQQDAYFASGLGCDPLATAVVELAELFLLDSTQTALSSDGLPSDPPDPGAFEVGLFVLAGCPPPTAGTCDPATEGFSVAASIDAIVLVPEPAPALGRLCALAALGALAAARRGVRAGERAHGGRLASS